MVARNMHNRISALIGASLLLSACGSRSLRGVVSDDGDVRSEFVADATIILAADIELPEDATTRPSADAFPDAISTTSADDGSFLFEALTAERFDLIMLHPNYFIASESISLKTENREIEVPAKAFVFDVSITATSRSNFIEDRAGSGFGYRAEENSQWLIVTVQLVSHSRSEEFRSFDSWTLVTSDGLKFSDRLSLNSPAGALADRVGPLGEISGNIYFEVPVGMGLDGAVLVPDLELGPSQIRISFP